MSWICIVVVMCLRGDADCHVDRAQCGQVEVGKEASIRTQCDEAANCVEPRRGIFVLKMDPPKPTPAPPARQVRNSSTCENPAASDGA